MSLDNLRSTSQSEGNWSASTQLYASSELVFRTNVTSESCKSRFRLTRFTMSAATGKIESSIVTGIPVQLINKPNDVNVFVNPATVSLTIVGGLKQITNILPEDIDVIIDFDLWNSEKQFYSPTIKLQIT